MNKFVETLFSKYNLDRHWSKRLKDLSSEKMPFKTKEEYDQAADELSREFAYTSDETEGCRVVGFMGNGGRITKFDKDSGYIVVYVNDEQHGSNTISFYKGSVSSYLRKKKNNYTRELQAGDDLGMFDSKFIKMADSK